MIISRLEAAISLFCLRENATILLLLQNAREREEARKKTLLRAEKQKEILVRDISRLWINASESGDFLIVCRGQEFPCHRAILSARFLCLSIKLLSVLISSSTICIGHQHLQVALHPVCLRQEAGKGYYG